MQLTEGVKSVTSDNFSAWLEDELAARNWKPADLAMRAGITQAAISNILNGNREIGAKAALAIAGALNLPPDRVFREAGILPASPGPERDPTFQELLDIMKNLPPDERQEILDYALYRFRRMNGESDA